MRNRWGIVILGFAMMLFAGAILIVTIQEKNTFQDGYVRCGTVIGIVNQRPELQDQAQVPLQGQVRLGALTGELRELTEKSATEEFKKDITIGMGLLLAGAVIMIFGIARRIYLDRPATF